MNRCGWCGCFCDNDGNVITPNESLIDQEEQLPHSSCNKCLGSHGLNDSISEYDNMRINKIRENYNKKLSTGDY